MSIRGGRLVAFSPILAAVLFLLTVNHGEAIWLTIPPTGGTKCVSEEIQSNVVVLADYYVVDEHDPEHTATISSKVRLRFCFFRRLVRFNFAGLGFRFRVLIVF